MYLSSALSFPGWTNDFSVCSVFQPLPALATASSYLSWLQYFRGSLPTGIQCNNHFPWPAGYILGWPSSVHCWLTLSSCPPSPNLLLWKTAFCLDNLLRVLPSGIPAFLNNLLFCVNMLMMHSIPLARLMWSNTVSPSIKLWGAPLMIRHQLSIKSLTTTL